MSEKLSFNVLVDNENGEGKREVIVEISTWEIAKAMKGSLDYLPDFLDNLCNGYFTEYKDGIRIGEGLHRTHRTLQATVVRFLLGIIVGISHQKYTDERNERPVALGQELERMIEDGTLKMGWMI
jgi:hypothetical protein